MIHIEHDTGHCPECMNHTVIYGGSASGRNADPFRMCANCGDHDVRRKTADADWSADALIAMVREIWQL